MDRGEEENAAAGGGFGGGDTTDGFTFGGDDTTDVFAFGGVDDIIGGFTYDDATGGIIADDDDTTGGFPTGGWEETIYRQLFDKEVPVDQAPALGEPELDTNDLALANELTQFNQAIDEAAKQKAENAYFVGDENGFRMDGKYYDWKGNPVYFGNGQTAFGTVEELDRYFKDAATSDQSAADRSQVSDQPPKVYTNYYLPAQARAGGPKSKYRLQRAAAHHNFKDYYNYRPKLLTAFSTINTDNKQLTFVYNDNNSLVYSAMSLEKVKSFLLDRPADRPLKSWIQHGPTDAGGRQAFNTKPFCLLDCCPLQRGSKGMGPSLIAAGEYRVAFDELERFRVSEQLDPYTLSGFVHLYCAERFIGLPVLLNNCHLVADSRRTMVGEPNNHFHAGLHDWEQQIVDDTLHEIGLGNGEYVGYPTAAQFAGAMGCHQGSLTHLLYQSKIKGNPRTAYRGDKPHGTHGCVHMGDLEIQYAGRLERSNKPIPIGHQALLDGALESHGKAIAAYEQAAAEKKRKREDVAREAGEAKKRCARK